MIAIENNTRKKVVFKYPAAGQEASMLIESDALQRVQHPRIVTLLGIARNNANKKSALILEYAEEGDLMSFLQDKAVSGKERLPESAARTLVLQLLKALDYCAQQRVHHRDVKPENIFLDHNFCCVLGDFGLATTEDTSIEWNAAPVGTAGYMAPEVMKTKNTWRQRNIHLQKPHQAASDVWSVGVVLFVSLFGVPPFGDMNEDDDWWYNKIYHGKWDEFFSTHREVYQHEMGTAQYPTLSMQALDVLKLMLCADVNKRGTLNDIMNHSFFTKNVLGPHAALL